MKITKYGHSCLLIEESGARILIDPGTMSKGFEDLRDLSAILITHQHADHVDFVRLEQLVADNPHVQIVSDEGAHDLLAQHKLHGKVVHEGDEFEIAGVKISVHGKWHEVIHPNLPNVPNVGYLIAGRFFHPGDAHTSPKELVELLGLPTAGPWARLSDTTDYALKVKPKIVVPIHDGILANPAMFNGWIGSLLKEHGIELISIENGKTIEL